MLIEKKKQSTKHITKKMAEQTALNIQAYWAEKGYSIHVWVERGKREPGKLFER